MKKTNTKSWLVILSFVLLSFSTACQTAQKMPEADAIEGIVGEYLKERKAKTCSGSVVLDSLSINEVGAFDASMGGFPVYAAFSVTCQEGNDSMSWTGDGGKDAAAAYVRSKSLGGYEAFTPAIFEQFLNK